MNYTGEKFTEAEAAAIMARARANILLGRAENLRQRDGEIMRRQDGADGQRDFVVKTRDNARVLPSAPDAPVPQQGAETLEEAVGQVIAKLFDRVYDDFEAALDKRDAEIKLLREQIDIEIKLDRKLAKLKSELAEARRQQPSFEAELTALREKVAKQEKTITRLRGEASQLAYRQQQLDSQQQKNKHEISVTAVKVTSIGSATREILQGLRQDGWLGEMPNLPARPGFLS
jgi:hypothetical protein